MPTIETALINLKNNLSTYRRQGVKAVIVIHGYGSSGVGGGIKVAVTRLLGDTSMSGVVRAYAGGEQWYYKKRELTTICKSLEAYERRIAGNEGVTVVLLK